MPHSRPAVTDDNVHELYTKFEANDLPDHIRQTYDEHHHVPVYALDSSKEVDVVDDTAPKRSIADLLKTTKQPSIADATLDFYYIWNMLFGLTCVAFGSLHVFANRSCYEFHSGKKASESVFEIIGILVIALGIVLIVISIATLITRMGHQVFMPIKYKHYNNQRELDA